MRGHHTKFGPNRFSLFDFYWKQTKRQTDKQSITLNSCLQIFKKCNMSQINPKEVFHNIAYSVLLPCIAGHSL